MISKNVMKKCMQAIFGYGVGVLPFLMVFPLDWAGIEPPGAIALAFVPSVALVLLFGRAGYLNEA